MKKLALHWKILLGMLLGVVFALIMTNFDFGKDFYQRLDKTIWNHLHQLIKIDCSTT